MERPMKRNLKITNEPIAEASLFAHRQSSDAAGAVIYFLGIVRGIEESAAIDAIEYETFQKWPSIKFHLLLMKSRSVGPFNPCASFIVLESSK